MFLLRRIWEAALIASESEYFPSLTIDGKELGFYPKDEWCQ